MSKTKYERGKTLTYPSIYPVLTFTPIFGHRGDFVWIEKVMAAWPEHDSEFAFVNSTMHDERVDRLKAENAKLKEIVRDLYRCDGESCTHCKYWNQGEGFYCNLGVGWKARRMRELGIEAEND